MAYIIKAGPPRKSTQPTSIGEVYNKKLKDFEKYIDSLVYKTLGKKGGDAPVVWITHKGGLRALVRTSRRFDWVRLEDLPRFPYVTRNQYKNEKYREIIGGVKKPTALKKDKKGKFSLTIASLNSIFEKAEENAKKFYSGFGKSSVGFNPLPDNFMEDRKVKEKTKEEQGKKKKGTEDKEHVQVLELIRDLQRVYCNIHGDYKLIRQEGILTISPVFTKESKAFALDKLKELNIHYEPQEVELGFAEETPELRPEDFTKYTSGKVGGERLGKGSAVVMSKKAYEEAINNIAKIAAKTAPRKDEWYHKAGFPEEVTINIKNPELDKPIKNVQLGVSTGILYHNHNYYDNETGEYHPIGFHPITAGHEINEGAFKKAELEYKNRKQEYEKNPENIKLLDFFEEADLKYNSLKERYEKTPENTELSKAFKEAKLEYNKLRKEYPKNFKLFKTLKDAENRMDNIYYATSMEHRDSMAEINLYGKKRTPPWNELFIIKDKEGNEFYLQKDMAEKHLKTEYINGNLITLENHPDSVTGKWKDKPVKAEIIYRLYKKTPEGELDVVKDLAFYRMHNYVGECLVEDSEGWVPIKNSLNNYDSLIRTYIENKYRKALPKEYITLNKENAINVRQRIVEEVIKTNKEEIKDYTNWLTEADKIIEDDFEEDYKNKWIKYNLENSTKYNELFEINRNLTMKKITGLDEEEKKKYDESVKAINKLWEHQKKDSKYIDRLKKYKSSEGIRAFNDYYADINSIPEREKEQGDLSKRKLYEEKYRKVAVGITRETIEPAKSSNVIEYILKYKNNFDKSLRLSLSNIENNKGIEDKDGVKKYIEKTSENYFKDVLINMCRTYYGEQGAVMAAHFCRNHHKFNINPKWEKKWDKYLERYAHNVSDEDYKAYLKNKKLYRQSMDNPDEESLLLDKINSFEDKIGDAKFNFAKSNGFLPYLIKDMPEVPTKNIGIMQNIVANKAASKATKRIKKAKVDRLEQIQNDIKSSPEYNKLRAFYKEYESIKKEKNNVRDDKEQYVHLLEKLMEYKELFPELKNNFLEKEASILTSHGLIPTLNIKGKYLKFWRDKKGVLRNEEIDENNYSLPIEAIETVDPDDFVSGEYAASYPILSSIRPDSELPEDIKNKEPWIKLFREVEESSGKEKLAKADNLNKQLKAVLSGEEVTPTSFKDAMKIRADKEGVPFNKLFIKDYVERTPFDAFDDKGYENNFLRLIRPKLTSNEEAINYFMRINKHAPNLIAALSTGDKDELKSADIDNLVSGNPVSRSLANEELQYYTKHWDWENKPELRDLKGVPDWVKTDIFSVLSNPSMNNIDKFNEVSNIVREKAPKWERKFKQSQEVVESKTAKPVLAPSDKKREYLSKPPSEEEIREAEQYAQSKAKEAEERVKGIESKVSSVEETYKPIIEQRKGREEYIRSLKEAKRKKKEAPENVPSPASFKEDLLSTLRGLPKEKMKVTTPEPEQSTIPEVKEKPSSFYIPSKDILSALKGSSVKPPGPRVKSQDIFKPDEQILESYDLDASFYEMMGKPMSDNGLLYRIGRFTNGY